MDFLQRLPCGFTVIHLMIVLMTFRAVTSLKYKNMKCYQQQECICAFPSGLGINLTSLGADPVVLQDTVNNLKFYFNPCSNVLAACPDTSVLCMIDEKTNQTSQLGLRGGATFLSQGLDEPVRLSYDFKGVGSEIYLKCTESGESKLLLSNDDIGPNPDVKFHFELQSPAACLRPVKELSKSLSTGVIFFLIFVIIFAAYIVLGSISNHMLQGAEGLEMIPNYGFWRNLPNSCLNGLKFMARGCRSPPTYEAI